MPLNFIICVQLCIYQELQISCVIEDLFPVLVLNKEIINTASMTVIDESVKVTKKNYKIFNKIQKIEGPVQIFRAERKERLRHSHFMDEPARQVNLDFVLASASGLGFSFEIIRTSHTRITPSDDAEAKMLGVSQAWPSIFFLETTSPFTRVG